MKNEAGSAGSTEAPRSVHFSRADLAAILAERLGLAPGELPAFWNVAPDGDFLGVTVWL